MSEICAVIAAYFFACYKFTTIGYNQQKERSGGKHFPPSDLNSKVRDLFLFNTPHLT